MSKQTEEKLNILMGLTGENFQVNGYQKLGGELSRAYYDYKKELKEFLGKLREETKCDQTKYAIDDFLN